MGDLERGGEPRPAPASAAPLGAPTPASNRRRRWLLAVLLVMVVLGGTTVPGLPPRPRDTSAPSVPADTDAPFPSDTASDVVSYADHVALVTAISESEAPPGSVPPQGTFPPGETAVYRQVTFRVDATQWSRPGAPTAPERFTALWWGWLVKGDQRRPFIVQGAPTVFVGAQYVMPIAYDGDAYSAIQPFAVFRVGRDSIALEEQDTPLAAELEGKAHDEVKAVFANALPDMVALRYGHLLPKARLAAVLASQAEAAARFASGRGVNPGRGPTASRGARRSCPDRWASAVLCGCSRAVPSLALIAVRTGDRAATAQALGR